MTARVLIADDDEVSRQLFTEVLEREGYDVASVSNGAKTLATLREATPDVLVVDVRMPGVSGVEVARVAHQEYPDLPVIVMTAFGSIETAIEAIHEGAFDFISKPMNLEEFKKIVRRAVAQRKLLNGLDGNSQPLDGTPVGTVIGKSPAMVEVYKTIARAAPTNSTVLILGESGTGKELIARAIHEHSSRAGRPFVAVDCGALTETLLASELFGHVRGAFTGAVSDKKGVFEEAEGGTCFLDEIGNINLNMQSKLLRILQEHELRRVGSHKWIKVDTRVIAATNKDLEELVKNGAYREDLFYRLKVLTIRLPPLRDRKEDIPALAKYFLNHYRRESGKGVNAISAEAVELLGAYSWPGNVRELENAIERAVVLANQTVITPEDLPAEIRDPTGASRASGSVNTDAFTISDLPSLDEVKKRYVFHVLNRCEGNISRAAKTLNIDRRSLYRMLLRYKTERDEKD